VAGFFLRGFGVSGPSSTTILLGAAGAAAWAGDGCRRMGNLGVLGADGLKQPGAKFRPAIFESGTRVFQAACIGPRPGEGRRLCHPQQHVVQGIEIAKDGKRRRERGRTARACGFRLRHESRQRRCEVTLHGGNILQRVRTDFARGLPVPNTKAANGPLHIRQRRAQVPHRKPGRGRCGRRRRLGSRPRSPATPVRQKQGEESEFGSVGDRTIPCAGEDGEGVVATSGRLTD
jgi:hypothetical protein